MYFNNAFTRYTNELSQLRYNPLSVAQEREYLVKFKREECRVSFGRLVESYLRFVIYVLKDFKIADDINIMDVVQEGNLGLMESIRNFDIRRESRISTYGIYWIRFYITKFIKPPDNTKLIYHYTCGVHGGSFIKNSKCPYCNCALVPVRRSIITSFSEGDDKGFIESGVKEQAAADIIAFAFNGKLTGREKFILTQFFGLQSPYHAKTLQEIGSMLHLNFERIRQLKEGALKKLNKECVSKLVSV